MICIFNDWALLELSGECPFVFTKNELENHGEDSKSHRDRVNAQAVVKGQLGTADEG